MAEPEAEGATRGLWAGAAEAAGQAGEEVLGSPAMLIGLGMGSLSCLAMTSSKVMVWAIAVAPWQASAKPYASWQAIRVPSAECHAWTAAAMLSPVATALQSHLFGTVSGRAA